MSWLVPWIAAAFALFGIMLLPIAAFIGVAPRSDDVLNGAQNCLIIATLIFLSYVVVVLGKEFMQFQRPSRN
jgi:hypothetical protein